MASSRPTQSAEDTVYVEGLKELRSALRKLGQKGALEELKLANIKVGNLIVERGAAAAEASGGVARKVAPTLRSMKRANAAVVAAGNNSSVRMARGAEYGAIHDRPRQTSRGVRLGWNQFAPWRGNGDQAGYFLWPTIRRSRDDIRRLYAEEIKRLARPAFPD